MLWDGGFSMYNSIYIFLKLTCSIGKKTKPIPDKNKSIFSKPIILPAQLKEDFRVSSVKAYSNWWCKTPYHDFKLVPNYKYFALQ